MKLIDLKEYKFNTQDLESSIDRKFLDKFIVEFEREFFSRYSKNYLQYYEWMARSFRCSKHIIGASLFYCQTEHLGEGALSNVTSYTMYYSLHHAVSSFLVLLPHLSYKNLTQISHAQCLKQTKTQMSDREIMPVGLNELYNYLLMMREVFSYRLPLGSLNSSQCFSSSTHKENLERYKLLLPVLLQLTNVTSHIVYKLSKSIFSDLKDQYHLLQDECDRIFFDVIRIRDRLEKYNEFDKDDYSMFNWLFRKMQLPYPQDWILTEKICEDLECGWWSKYDDNDFDISSVGQRLSDWLE